MKVALVLKMHSVMLIKNMYFLNKCQLVFNHSCGSLGKESMLKMSRIHLYSSESWQTSTSVL